MQQHLKDKCRVGLIHHTALTSGLLPTTQEERLRANGFINLHGGRKPQPCSGWIFEMLNRNSKVAHSGHQTEDSIVQNSKEYPHYKYCKTLWCYKWQGKNTFHTTKRMSESFDLNSKGSSGDKNFRTYQQSAF